MRIMLALATLVLAAPMATAADPAVDAACRLERSWFGWDEGCEELRDPQRVGDAAACPAASTECPALLDLHLESGWGRYYLSLAPPGVFRESNGCDGLQTNASACAAADARADPRRDLPWGFQHDPLFATTPRFACVLERTARPDAVVCRALADEQGAYQRLGCSADRAFAQPGVCEPLPVGERDLLPPACVVERELAGASPACSLVDEAARAMNVGFCGALHFVAGPHSRSPCGALAALAHETGTYYVGWGPLGLRVESNGCAGLQQEPTDCDGDGQTDAADRPMWPSDVRRLLGLP